MFQEIEKAITSPARAILVIIRTRKFQNNIAACRLDHLIKNYGLNPRDILVITYANWGRSRILGKVNKNNDGLGWRNSDFTTINKVCREILSEERSNVRSGGVFVDAIQEIAEELNIPFQKKMATVLGRLAWIETKNNKAFEVGDYLIVINSVFNNISKGTELITFRDIKDIYSKLIEKISDKRLWYRNDIFIRTMILLDNEEIRSKWGRRVKAVIYDRFDSVCPFEFGVIKRLVDVNRNLFCVGYPASRKTWKKSFWNISQIV